MRLQTALRYLVFFFLLLLVSFAVLLGGAAIARLADDRFAAWLLDSAALAVGLLWVIDGILLVGAVAVTVLIESNRQRDEQRMRRRLTREIRREDRRRGDDRPHQRRRRRD